MSKADTVEEILARLMPVAMSESAEEEIFDNLEELASTLDHESVGGVPKRWPWITGAAAAFGLSALGVLHTSHSSPNRGTLAASPDSLPSLVNLSRIDTLQSIEGQGWWEDGEGNAHQSLRLNMVAHQEILDQETGIRMTVSEPREETILVPVSTF